MKNQTISNLRDLFNSYSELFEYSEVNQSEKIKNKVFEAYGTNIDLSLLDESVYSLIENRISKDAFEYIVSQTVYYTSKNDFVYPSNMVFNKLEFDDHTGEITFEATILDRLTDKKYDISVNDVSICESLKNLDIKTTEYVERNPLESFSSFLLTKES